MTLPALLVGFLVSTLIGAAFHVWRGGTAGKLLLYLILSWLGFWIGQFIATQLGLTFASLGPLHLGAAIICELIFLAIGHWLSLAPDRSENRK